MCASGGRTGGQLAISAGKTSILVVDDDPAVAATTRQYLQQLAGVTVTVETEPTDALATVDAGRVDVVVSDYEMPGMDGLALLDAVRECDPDVAFVLFTAGGDERVADRVRECDAGYVRKGGEAGGFPRLVDRVADGLDGGGLATTTDPED